MSTYEFDVILLDLSLPDMHGHEVVRQLRTQRIATPVLILSGDGETGTKVTGFGAGADDYVTKPFDRDELLARINALVRRSKGHAQSQITTGPVVIDLATRTVEVAGRRVGLTGKEYAIFEMLSLRKGMTLTKEMYLTHLYGGRDEPELKIIDVFICKLRKKTAPGRSAGQRMHRNRLEPGICAAQSRAGTCRKSRITAPRNAAGPAAHVAGQSHRRSACRHRGAAVNRLRPVAAACLARG